MGIEKGIFNRTSLLLGDDVMGDIYQKRVIIFGLGGVGSWCAESLVRSGIKDIYQKRVIIFGLGGVGSWCAESLVRSGIKELVLVDSDRVCVTNVNRQLMATTKTVGQVKVDVLKNRLLEINPHANIVALQDIYEEANTDKFQLDTFDYIIDAIDSLENKMQLLWHATRTKATVFSSMGAALKMDPTRIKVAEFWKVAGCPLARALRDKFKKRLPARPRPARQVQEKENGSQEKSAMRLQRRTPEKPWQEFLLRNGRLHVPQGAPRKERSRTPECKPGRSRMVQQ